MKHERIIKHLFSAVLLLNTVFSQGNEYLAQKLMVESDLRKRITDALSKIIDDRKYVIDVDAEIEIMAGSEEQITIMDEGEKEPAITILPTEIEKSLTKSAEFRSGTSKGLPIPGFEFDVDAYSSETTEEKAAVSTPSSTTETGAKKNKVLSRTVTNKQPSTAHIKKLDISIILQEGAAPELIENIRQVVMVASRFNRARGDALSIMTATFKERRDEKTAEQILLKNIAEKLESLEQQQSKEQQVNWKDELENYKSQEADRREKDKMYFQQQLVLLENAARERAYQSEKRDMLRKDSLKLQALNDEITTLKSMVSTGGDDTSQTSSAIGQKVTEKETLDTQIAEKLAMLDAVQSDLDKSMGRGDSSSTMMIVFVSLLGALVIVLVVVLVIMIMGNKQKQQLPPPWMYPPMPRKKKRFESEKAAEHESGVKPMSQPMPIQEQLKSEDPGVLQSEISDMRQAVVSMSVSQPGTATRIVKEWMENDVPPAEPAPSVPPPSPQPEAESRDKKKKKK